MKFIHYLETITGVGILGMISLFIFFVLFCFMAIWAWKADDRFIDVLKKIPLQPLLPSEKKIT